VDYSALENVADPELVSAFARSTTHRSRQWRVKPPPPKTSASDIAKLVFMSMVVPALFIASLLAFNPIGNPSIVIAIISIFPIFGAVAIAASIRHKAPPTTWETLYRLSNFATANGLVFSPRDKRPSYPGLIFRRGYKADVTNHVSSTTGRFFDFGNFRWLEGAQSGQDNWRQQGFLAVRLDRRLPHIVLDAKANGTLRTVGSNRQVLSLEGDFDNYFTLYCPPEYEIDALYVLTPDLMALLIDESDAFDVEIVDDWMFVHSAVPFDTANPDTVKRLMRIVSTVGAKAVRRSTNYRDERVGDFAANVVAPRGRRMVWGIPPRYALLLGIVILAAAVICVSSVLSFISNMHITVTVTH
jgi:hypothetical protein